ncbi:MAG: DUF2752 domain-containing protein [Bacteroidota bacterium]
MRKTIVSQHEAVTTMKKVLQKYFELILWIVALLFLACIDPYASQQFSLCPLNNLGFDYCPGCGLGRSVSHILHGNLQASISAHLLGLPALLILIHRIIQILFLRVCQFRKYSSYHLS